MPEFTTTLHETLQGYTLPDGSRPYFAKVFKGEPGALMPTGGPMARWRVSRIQEPPEGPRTLSGLVMREMVFSAFCYWPLSATEAATDMTEDNIATVMVDLPPRFIRPALTDAYTIGGVPVTTLTLDGNPVTQADFPTLNSEVQVRVFQFDILARLLEES